MAWEGGYQICICYNTALEVPLANSCTFLSLSLNWVCFLCGQGEGCSGVRHSAASYMERRKAADQLCTHAGSNSISAGTNYECGNISKYEMWMWTLEMLIERHVWWQLKKNLQTDRSVTCAVGCYWFTHMHSHFQTRYWYWVIDVHIQQYQD